MTTPRKPPADPDLTRAPARRGQGDPLEALFFGGLLLLFAVIIITIQTQTNMAYINGASSKDEVIQAQWSIWLQIPKLIFGNVVPGPPVTTKSLPGIVIGQGVELVHLALVKGFDSAVHSTRKLHRLLALVVLVFMVAISIFNFYTDLIYGDMPEEAHWFFALFCTFVVGFFPTWGLTLIRRAWQGA